MKKIFLILASLMIDNINSFSESTKPLISAIQNNDLKAVKEVIDKAGINDIDCNNITPLALALRVASEDIVKELLTKNPDLTIKDDLRNTVYNSAAGNRYYNTMSVLLTHTMNNKTFDLKYFLDTNISGFTPLMSATYVDNYLTIRSITTVLTERLSFIQISAQMNHQENKGRTALYFAIENGNLDLVTTYCKFLPEKEKNPIDKENKQTPLHYIMLALNKIGHENVYKFAPKIILTLIEHGGDLKAKDKNGFTPLDYLKKEKKNNKIYEYIEKFLQNK